MGATQDGGDGSAVHSVGCELSPRQQPSVGLNTRRVGKKECPFDIRDFV
jgi:hypothetical protein